MDVLFALLNSISTENVPTNCENEFIRDYLFLNFHATELESMKDALENRIITNNLYGKRDNRLDFIKQIVGFPCVVSFCNSKESIPMWTIYGKDNHGVCLKFDVNELKNYNWKINQCDKNDIVINDCEYLTDREINNYIQELKQVLNNKNLPNNDIHLREIVKKSPFIKDFRYKYEDECRMVKWTQNIKYKMVGNSLRMFDTIKIPLKSLKEITLGAYSNTKIIKHALEKFVNGKFKGFDKYGIEIPKLSISSIKLREV